jgi:hypothetical protein
MLETKFINIIKNKNFNNVWGMLQYLIDLGLETNDIFETISEFFNESDYFKNVAYARILGVTKDNEENNFIIDVQFVLFIGVIDEFNDKLSKLFNSYRIAVAENKIHNDKQNDLDKFCKEKYEFINLSASTIDYLDNIAIKHYGHTIKI